MRNRSLGSLLLVTAVLMLAACGGGGGGVASTPTPPPAPPPPPPPPPPTPTSPAIFPNITTDTNFAVLGKASAFDPQIGFLYSDQFVVRYDAASKNYLIDLPWHDPSPFISASDDDKYWYSGNGLKIFKPSNVQLTYTSFGVYSFPCASGSGSSCVAETGAFAFGLATPASDVPVTGTASYVAYVADSNADDYPAPKIGGSAILQFDFAAGTLGGYFDPFVGTSSLGRYNFESTVFGVGSTTFSGSMLNAQSSGNGSFNGMFTGPSAQELMAQWALSIPSTDPNVEDSAYSGVWVGKKCC